MSIDELLAPESNVPNVNLIFAIERALQEKADCRGQHSLTESERVVVTFETLLREVHNGGFQQYFASSSNAYAAYAVESLRRLGYPNLANVTQRAIDALGSRDIALRDEELDECDYLFFAERADFEGRMLEFVKAHRTDILAE